MGNYLSKYKGVYKLMVDLNPLTNDFYKNSRGDNIDTEIFIQCKYGRISHYGGNILTAYLEPCDDSYKTNKYDEWYYGNYDSNQKCHKRPDDDYIFDENDENTGSKDKRLYNTDGSEYPYKKIYRLKSYSQKFSRVVKEISNVILDGTIVESDIGGSFRFKAKDIDIVVTAMGKLKNGIKTSVFSTRYLPKADYTIPTEDIIKMKKATSKFDKSNRYLIAKLYKDFATIKELDMNKLKKELKLKPKDIFHKLGLFEELIAFIDNVEV